MTLARKEENWRSCFCDTRLRAANMPLMDAAAVQASLEAKLSHTGSSRPVLQFNQFPDELLVIVYNQV